jgi:Uma2 family endonuclease
MARAPLIETGTASRVVLKFQSVPLTDDQFLRLCRDNGEFHFEMTARGDLIIMSPSNPDTDSENTKIIQRLANWAEKDGTGKCFGAAAIFILPNGAKRVPDAAWIPKDRWKNVTKGKKYGLPVICPDFIIELRSPSDRLRDVQEKMEEYVSNGTRLGWLLDPIENCAFVYLPGQPPKRIDNPAILSGDPVLPGFTFDFSEILQG